VRAETQVGGAVAERQERWLKRRNSEEEERLEKQPENVPVRAQGKVGEPSAKGAWKQAHLAPRGNPIAAASPTRDVFSGTNLTRGMAGHFSGLRFRHSSYGRVHAIEGS
jgi:hypothetical protein